MSDGVRHKFEIRSVSEPRTAELFMDGQPLMSVTRYEIKQDALDFKRITIEFIAEDIVMISDKPSDV